MKLFNDERAFTGLEAAIVLTAFVVVAAVFSYVVLGAGFFTSEKSKEVIHTSVDQATSSAEVVGDIIGIADSNKTKIEYINFTLELTAGNKPLDLNKSSISYTTSSLHNSSVDWTYTVYNGDDDSMLERNEKAEINVTVPGTLGTYTQFQLEFKPSTGGTLAISKTTPGSIDAITRLY